MRCAVKPNTAGRSQRTAKTFVTSAGHALKATTVAHTPAVVPEVADQIPGLDDPVVTVPANITAWLDANATTVNAYLVRVSWVDALLGSRKP